MKKISQLLESTNDSLWSVKIDLTLFIESANEGEAAFLADKLLNELSIKKVLTIEKIEKIEKI
jgi:hypothetical protein